MGITVREALELDVLRNARVVAGEGGMSNVIETVSVIETPDADLWFYGGELFLTAFYAVKNDVQAQLRMLETMARVGSAGLVICYRERHMKEIPAEVIAYANAVNIPILELPDSRVMYFEIVNAVLGRIISKKTEYLEYAKKVHDQLIHLVLKGKGLRDVCRALADLVQNPVLIVDSALRPIVTSASFQAELEQKVVKALAPNFLVSDGSIRLPAGDSKVFHLEVDACSGCRVAVCLPITVDGRLLGLLVVPQVGEKLDEWKIVTLEEGSIVIALELVKQEALNETRRRLEKDLFDELVSGIAENELIIAERASSLGWDLSKYHIVLIVEHDVGRKTCSRPGAITPSWFGAVSAVVQAYDPKAVMILKSHSIVILPYIEDWDDEEFVKRKARIIAEKILNNISKPKSPTSVRIGISRPFQTVDQLGTAYRQARCALKIVRKLKTDVTIAFFDEFEGYSLLDSLKKKEDLRAFYERVFRKLIEYDRINGTDLALTLETYLLCKGNSTETARKLFIHRNSLKYRKDKIKEVLGTDPFSGPAYANFYLAALAKQLA